MPLTPYQVQEDYQAGNGEFLFLHPQYNLLTTTRLFLIEGIATVIFGVALWFLLPDCASHELQDLLIPTQNIKSLRC